MRAAPHGAGGCFARFEGRIVTPSPALTS
jgi:hypothetical protein